MEVATAITTIAPQAIAGTIAIAQTTEAPKAIAIAIAQATKATKAIAKATVVVAVVAGHCVRG
jgi:hypothetical protein